MSKKNKNKKQSRGHPNRRRPASNSGMSGAGLEMLSCYVKSLVCPFDSGGCRLGWGTLFPTELSAAWYRTSVSANADGSLAIAILADCSNLLQYNNSGAAVASWTTNASSNFGPLNNNFTSARPISLGVRARPNIAMTAAPGRGFAGSIFQINRTNLTSMTPTDLINLQTSKMFPGYVGILSTGRPCDTSSFEFFATTLSGWGAGAPLNFTIPYIVWTGLPGSALVDVEVMFNFEGVAMQEHGLLYTPVLSNVASPALSDVGSVEQIQKLIRPRVIETVYASEPAPGSTPEGAGVSWANSLGAAAGSGLATAGFGLGLKALYQRARSRARNSRFYGGPLD